MRDNAKRQQSNTVATDGDWIRAPKKGVCPRCGLSRAKLYELAGAGEIRSVSLREKHQIKGTRLFYLPSIFALYERCEKQQVKAG